MPQLEAIERVPTTRYDPPADVKLEEVNEPMRVVCHVSPDAGWPTLKAFLTGTTGRLTVGMYDFTAPHIISAVKSATKKPPRRLNLVIQHGSATEGGAKANDVPDEEVVRDLANVLKTRFDQAWASVSGPNRLFASAYHIKVAVRDGKAFWLSSGNWQSSNQPEIDPVGDGERSFTPLRSFNREWHAVVESPALAGQFEKFLLFDLEQAREVEEEAVEVETPMAAIPADVFADEGPEAEAATGARYFPPLTVERKLRVMPLLTPDNFQKEVLKLVKGARKRICFQNQSLNPLLDHRDDDGFFDLVTALRDKQKEAGRRPDHHPGRLLPPPGARTAQGPRVRHDESPGPEEVPHQGGRGRLCPRRAREPQLDQPGDPGQPRRQPDLLRCGDRTILREDF